MFAEGVDVDACHESFRLIVARNGDDTVVDLDDPLELAAKVTDGDVASLELSLVAPLPHVGLRGTGQVGAVPAEPSGTRPVRDRDGEIAELPVYTLLDQGPGAQADGPAVVEGPFFTMRLPDGWRFQTTAAGDVLLTDRRGD
jgi:N-methylhydantoinase A/oxoprolinase/acetone carboxylase beta subunit